MGLFAVSHLNPLPYAMSDYCAPARLVVGRPHTYRRIKTDMTGRISKYAIGDAICNNTRKDVLKLYNKVEPLIKQGDSKEAVAEKLVKDNEALELIKSIRHCKADVKLNKRDEKCAKWGEKLVTGILCRHDKVLSLITEAAKERSTERGTEEITHPATGKRGDPADLAESPASVTKRRKYTARIEPNPAHETDKEGSRRNSLESCPLLCHVSCHFWTQLQWWVITKP